MKKILVVEDEQRIAELLQKGLEEFGYVVSLAFDGEMGRRLVNSNTYDLIITDVVLPNINGFELCKVIREKDPHIPILMLTALGTTDDKLDGFDAGVDDYMVKPFDLRELNARINVLLKRKVQTENVDPVTELQYKDLLLDVNTKSLFRGNREIKLTPKEFTLLRYMMENPERILSRVEIAEKVWDTHFDTGTNFIDVYINYLRKKIDKDFEVKLIHTRQGMGFILTE
ncbi:MULTISPECIES: response regulator transcription factor [unclassified Dysgonomonas]|uniref:response regulator transcription factor n=1 Tax=unclassified Dysgonomonas TaxID=2630389 RepID=UPI000681FCC5|nr:MULTISPECIES: response regulator transcription factor [unclassified Dysgonomonas]MBD8346671.1 response regulator transcription factor [Dysgonomonas sp. HGC4]MBF0574399.1 response regulator transcription factor [Dysgonomonas sp. GY617]